MLHFPPGLRVLGGDREGDTACLPHPGPATLCSCNAPVYAADTEPGLRRGWLGSLTPQGNGPPGLRDT